MNRPASRPVTGTDDFAVRPYRLCGWARSRLADRAEHERYRLALRALTTGNRTEAGNHRRTCAKATRPVEPLGRASHRVHARVPCRWRRLGALYAPFDLQAGSDGFNTGLAFPEVLIAMVKAAHAMDCQHPHVFYAQAHL